MSINDPRGTVQRNAQMVEMFNAGHTTTELAAKFQISRGRVGQILCRQRADGVFVRVRAPARSASEVRRAKAESMARQRAADPEKYRSRCRAHYAANRDSRRLALKQKRDRCFFWGRSKGLRGHDRATAKDLASMWRNQRGLCALTGVRLGRTAHLDHITPRVRGGGDQPSNLRWLSPAANHAKRELSDAEFISLCAAVVRIHGT